MCPDFLEAHNATDSLNSLEELLNLRRTADLQAGQWPAYEQKKARELLDRLERLTMPEVPQSAPRFGFRKAKRVEKEPSTADVVTDAKSPEYSVQKTTSPGLVSKRQREHIISDAAFGVVGGSHSLSNLVECIVDLRAQQVSAIYLNQLDRCLVLAPTVTGSVFVQNARQCVFMLGCHQLRIHNSCDVRVFLTSHNEPITEGCTNIVYAPFSNHERVLSAVDFDRPHAVVAYPSDDEWTHKLQVQRRLLQDIPHSFMAESEVLKQLEAFDLTKSYQALSAKDDT